MKAPAFMLLLPLALAARAQAPAPPPDRAELERTPIVGNRELPKVLYIVPWKKPPAPPPARQPPPGLSDPALQPVDRDVLRRELKLQQANPGARP